jgi:hypothetical protein
VILRCTARLIELIGCRGDSIVDAPAADDDWYANVLWIDRRKCVLLTHAETLFSVFAADVRKADLRAPGVFATALIADALAREELPAKTFGRLDGNDVHVARTASRSVLGHMNDMAFTCTYAVELAGGLARTDIADLNHRLRRGLHNRGGYVVPVELAASRAGPGRG